MLPGPFSPKFWRLRPAPEGNLHESRASLSPAGGGREMTTIANYENIERAEVARSLLADCGIAAFIPDDFLVTYR